LPCIDRSVLCPNRVFHQDIQRWITQLLDRYSGAYASIQFRALRQFFKWRAGEDESRTRWPGSGRRRSP